MCSTCTEVCADLVQRLIAPIDFARHSALLQGSYFTAVDLATIGQKLDERERAVVGSSTALQQGCNYDDSGYFSIQVRGVHPLP